jgi:hypothetical protein
MRRSAVAILTVLALIGLVSSALAGTTHAGGAARAGGIHLAKAGHGVPGPIGKAAAKAIRSGPLPSDPVALRRAKAAAARRFDVEAPSSRPSVATVSPTPTIPLKKNGLAYAFSTPSDSTGAVSPTNYIETVNTQVGLWDRSLNALVVNSLNTWWGSAGASSFDPQVIWDPTTNRFYYAGDTIFSASDNRLSFGWSKTATPTNFTTDWCKYSVLYASEFPDYPKLGDSRYFAIIGVNVFNSSDMFLRSDIVAVGKPGPGTTCPSAASLPFGIGQNPKVGSAQQFTPVPANEIDTLSTGWVVTRSAALPSTTIGRFSVTRDGVTGQPIIQTAGTPITVPSYTVPANAPQNGSGRTLDTLDSRLTQAVAAIDPDRGNLVHVWTQHAVAGGAGSMERWYEIKISTATVAQTGVLSYPGLFAFNGAISPDRQVNGATSAFGSNMVLGYNTSSTATYPAVRVVSKRGTDTVSALVVVRASPGPDVDFACAGATAVCRWGDYSAATPDPAPAGGATGAVWLTNMWASGGTSTAQANWRTVNWTAVP